MPKARSRGLDLNLSITDAKGKRIYATAIEFGSKRLALGKEAGVYPKVGLVKGLDFGEVETDDFEDVVPTEDDGAEDVPDAEETELDLTEVA